MALESFYGGKPGVSPVIKARFKYIDKNDLAYKYAQNTLGWTEEALKPYTMEECFKDPEYPDVWYEELCIIDTDSKTNPNNGKLFKRTLTTNGDSSLHAEYLGQIVGPSGAIPNIEIGPLDDMRQKAAGRNNNGNYENVDSWEYAYPIKDNNNNINITFDSIEDNDNDRSNDYEKIAVLSADTTNMLVPGKDDNGNFNDDIKYTWCNVRHNLADSIEDSAWMYLGFKIPYPSFNITSEEIPYWSNEDVYSYSQKDDNEGNNVVHPFYHNLKFKIPRGTRGIGPEEIFVVGKNGNQKPNKLYSLNSIEHVTQDGQDVFQLKENPIEYVTSFPEGYSEQNTGNYRKLESNTYWVAKFVLYNSKLGINNNNPVLSNGVIYTYICDYNDIQSISLSDDGTLTITQSNGVNFTSEKTIQWINDITLDNRRLVNNQDNNTYGTITINYNTGNSDTVVMPLIKDITTKEETQDITYTFNTNDTIISGYISSIKEIAIDKRGHLLVLYKSSHDRPSPNVPNIVENTLYYTYTDNNSVLWVKSKYDDNHTSFPKINNDTTNWWQDLGSIVERNSVKLINEYDWNNGNNTRNLSNAIAALNAEYPNGDISTINSLGETVSSSGGLVFIKNLYETNSNDSLAITGFFYYDYSPAPNASLTTEAKGWSYLGSWEDMSEGDNKTIITKFQPYLNKMQELPWASDQKPKVTFTNGLSQTADPNESEVFSSIPWE